MSWPRHPGRWAKVHDSEGVAYFVDMVNALKVVNEIENDGELLIRCERENGETVEIIAKAMPRD